jgi:hypothetical protein
VIAGFTASHVLAQISPQTGESTVKRHMNGIRGHTQHGGNLACAQVGSVAQRDQLPVSRAKAADRTVNGESVDHARFEVVRRDRLVNPRCGQPFGVSSLQGSPRDSDQPGDRFAFPAVVSVPIAHRPLENFTRYIFGVRALSDPISHVRVDAPNKGFRVSEWVTRPHRLSVDPFRGNRGLGAQIRPRDLPRRGR